MFKTLAFVKRKPGMSSEAFRNYYETRHIALVAELAPSARCYRRNFIQFGDSANVNDDALDFDVVTELEFSSREDHDRWLAAMTSPEAQGLIGSDLLNFTDPTKFRVCVVEAVE